MSDYEIDNVFYAKRVDSGKYVSSSEPTPDSQHIEAPVSEIERMALEFTRPATLTVSLGKGTWYKFIGDPRGDCHAAPGWKDKPNP